MSLHEQQDNHAPSASRERVARSYDPFQEPLLSNPYPFFELARNAAPVFYAPNVDHWVVSRYKDVKRVFLDPATFSARNSSSPIHPLCAEATAILQQGDWKLTPALGNNDRPAHTRFRRNVQKAFTPRRVADLEPFIRQLAEASIERIASQRHAELMRELIFDLPALVILKMLGFSAEKAPVIKEGSRNRVLFVWGSPSPEEQAELALGMTAFFRHCRRLVDERAGHPEEDLTSDLLRVRAGDDSIFTLDEIASVLFAFFTAGHETTSNLLGNAVRQLLIHRETWEQICADPRLIPGAVDEVLRFDSSVVAWRRQATRGTHIAGTAIPEGAQVLLLLGAANHDESVFADPRRFDIARENASDHLSFGQGIHFCLGSALARLEATTMLEVMTRRLPTLRLDEEQQVRFIPNLSFHAPLELHVDWGG